MNTVPLATFNELEPAQKLQQRLQQAGLSATIKDESNLERFWFMTPPLAAVHLEVPQPQYLAARNVIAQLESVEGGLRDVVRCPECKSVRVEFPQLPRKFMTTTLFRIGMALRAVPQEFYCLDCHYTWPIAVPVRPKLDLLGFPHESLWSRFKKLLRRKHA